MFCTVTTFASSQSAIAMVKPSVQLRQAVSNFTSVQNYSYISRSRFSTNLRWRRRSHSSFPVERSFAMWAFL